MPFNSPRIATQRGHCLSNNTLRFDTEAVLPAVRAPKTAFAYRTLFGAEAAAGVLGPYEKPARA